MSRSGYVPVNSGVPSGDGGCSLSRLCRGGTATRRWPILVPFRLSHRRGAACAGLGAGVFQSLRSQPWQNGSAAVAPCGARGGWFASGHPARVD